MVADFRFFTRWRFAAPMRNVWDAVGDPTSYTRWFPHISDVSTVRPGGADGVGSVYAVHLSAKLPFALDLHVETVRREPPRLLELTSTGHVEGSGRWELTEEEGATTALLRWHAITQQRWMNLPEPLVRIAVAWNYRKVMDEGGGNLAQLLGARLLMNESGEDRHPA